MQYFWLDCYQNNCVRQGVFFTIIIIIFIFNFICIINTLMYYRKLKFQILPLTINTVVTFMLIFLSLFQQSYQFDIIVDIMEIYSYFLFTFTFANLNFDSHRGSFQLKSKHKRLFTTIFLIVTLIAVGTIIAIAVLFKKLNCKYNIESYSICLVVEFIQYIITLYFCYKIWNRIKFNYNNLAQNKLTQSIKDDEGFNMKDTYVEIRLKQVKILVFSFTLSMFFNSLQLLEIILDNIPIKCVQASNGNQLLTSDTLIGIILLTLGDISNLIPHIFIPIILYIIPIYLGAQYELKIQNIIIKDPEVISQKQSKFKRAMSELTNQLQIEKQLRDERDKRLNYSKRETNQTQS